MPLLRKKRPRPPLPLEVPPFLVRHKLQILQGLLQLPQPLRPLLTSTRLGLGLHQLLLLQVLTVAILVALPSKLLRQLASLPLFLVRKLVGRWRDVC